MFQSRARTMPIHYQLATMKKGNSTIAGCFHKFTSLANTLATLNLLLNDYDLISFLLTGFGSENNSFGTLVTTRVDHISLEDLYGHLLAHEIRLEQTSSALDLSNACADLAQRILCTWSITFRCQWSIIQWKFPQ